MSKRRESETVSTTLIVFFSKTGPVSTTILSLQILNSKPEKTGRRKLSLFMCEKITRQQYAHTYKYILLHLDKIRVFTSEGSIRK